MKNQQLWYVIPIILGMSLFAFFPIKEGKVSDELEIGAKAPLADLKVEDVSGRMLTLQEVAKEKGLLVNFSCNTCPWVARWENRYNPIARLAEENNIGVIMLNPNSGYRNRGESIKDMQERAQKSKYRFYYALDKDSKLAEAFGATHTPHVFLFDSDMKLVYRGAIDDNAGSAENVERPYLKNAIKALGSGEEINPQTTKSLGCTIKWPT
ncbi:MAG TPA: redoxin domain-containing protein [Balneolaceae bacterium]|nr:redoxin domain-containing protein [Balneolaceae bacterium]